MAEVNIILNSVEWNEPNLIYFTFYFYMDIRLFEWIISLPLTMYGDLHDLFYEVGLLLQLKVLMKWLLLEYRFPTRHHKEISTVAMLQDFAAHGTSVTLYFICSILNCLFSFKSQQWKYCYFTCVMTNNLLIWFELIKMIRIWLSKDEIYFKTSCMESWKPFVYSDIIFFEFISQSNGVVCNPIDWKPIRDAIKTLSWLIEKNKTSTLIN